MRRPGRHVALKRAVPPSQEAGLDFADLRLALAKLAPRQREALVLVAAEGMTYEEVAEIVAAKSGR
jgi:RNA polymerase sigma-70 factor, ECF subfamily